MCEGTEFKKCQKCKKGRLRVKASKQGSVFIACDNFPYCKNTMSLPKNITKLQILGEKCDSCKSKKFNFWSENKEGTFCISCQHDNDLV